MKATIKFRPLERETLQLLLHASETNGNDPLATYGRLVSATMVAAALIGLTPAQVAQQAEAFAEQAVKAVADRPEIFGGMH